MDTGVDGMMIDAVNWYVGCDWAKTRKRMTDVINSYGVKYSQPEGAGAFRDDPVPWVTDGGWACVQDYGLGILWEKGTNVISNAIETGDPRPLEPALRNYHDRVVEAGGILFFAPLRFEDAAKTHLAVAATAAFGDLLSWSAVFDGLWSPVIPDAEEAKVMKLKAAHPALFNRSRRLQLPVAAPERHYAFLRAAPDGSERVIVVLNFQPEAQTAEVNLSGVDFSTATDLLGGAVFGARAALARGTVARSATVSSSSTRGRTAAHEARAGAGADGSSSAVGGDRTSSPAALSFHAAAELHERPQRARVPRRRVSPLLPAQSPGRQVGAYELGPRRQPRPAALGASARWRWPKRTAS